LRLGGSGGRWWRMRRMSNGACCLSSRALQALRFRLLEAAGVSLEPIEFLLPVVLRDCVVLINRTKHHAFRILPAGINAHYACMQIGI